MTLTLTRASGDVVIEALPNGRRRVTVTTADPHQFIPVRSCETSYPVDLVSLLLEVRGPAWLCDEINRDEDPSYVAERLRVRMFAFVDPAWFEGKRLLDFGCGSGASTMVIARLIPHTEIVGVELNEDLLRAARARAEYYRLPHVTFLCSPGADTLPPNIGQFDAVMLNAVYEHLLPGERPALLQLIWAALKPGGILFVGETPHRYFPIESHTTGLPLLNYVPDRIAHAVARRFSRRVDPDASWEELLRAGIRGGTESEILRLLRATAAGTPVSLLPSRLGLSDGVDLYFSMLRKRERGPLFALLRLFAKLIGAVLRSALVPDLMLAIQKQ